MLWLVVRKVRLRLWYFNL